MIQNKQKQVQWRFNLGALLYTVTVTVTTDGMVVEFNNPKIPTMSAPHITRDMVRHHIIRHTHHRQ